MKTLSTKILWFITWRGDASLKKRILWRNNKREISTGSSKVANIFFLCLQELCFLIHAPLLAQGKELEFTRISVGSLKLQLEGTLFYQSLITAFPVQCNICNCLFFLLNSLSLGSNYIMKNNISTVSGKVVNFTLPFFSTGRRSHCSFFWNFRRCALGLFMCHWLRRSRQSSWGSRPLDHNTTTKNHSENHYQTHPKKSNSILSDSWDKNSTIVQNTSHRLWALQLILSLFFESIHESIKLLAPLVECHPVSSVCYWMLMNYFDVVKIKWFH